MGMKMHSTLPSLSNIVHMTFSSSYFWGAWIYSGLSTISSAGTDALSDVMVLYKHIRCEERDGTGQKQHGGQSRGVHHRWCLREQFEETDSINSASTMRKKEFYRTSAIS